MIVYNVTVKVDHEVHADWISWMKEVHIPDVIATGCFKDHRFLRILGQDESEGFTYAIQYIVEDMNTFHTYTEKYASKLQNEHSARYSEKFVAFRTMMEEV